MEINIKKKKKRADATANGAVYLSCGPAAAVKNIPPNE